MAAAKSRREWNACTMTIIDRSRCRGRFTKSQATLSHCQSELQSGQGDSASFDINNGLCVVFVLKCAVTIR